MTRWLLLLIPTALAVGCRGAEPKGQPGSERGAPAEPRVPMAPDHLAERMEELVRSAVEQAHVSGLALTPSVRIYGRDDLYEYLDGGAERYLGYSFDRLVRAEAAMPNDVFVVELYHFGSAADAYGIWSTDSAGERVGIGQGSAYGSGLLQFWRGQAFARLYHQKYQGTTRDTILGLGRSLAERLGEDGTPPALLAALPKEGLQGDPVFFHEQAMLNHLHYVADANLLRLGPQTEALFADYRRDGNKAKLLLVRYPKEQASDARQAFIRGFLEATPVKGPFVAKLENGLWSGVGEPKGHVLRVVFDATSREFALHLLAS